MKPWACQHCVSTGRAHHGARKFSLVVAICALAAVLTACGSNGSGKTAAPDTGSANPDNEREANGSIDLNGDGLTPGEQNDEHPPLTLYVDAEPGALLFGWPEAAENITSVKLYVHDVESDIEEAVDLAISNNTLITRLPIVSHLTAWNRLQYRVERCFPECLSSRRRPIAPVFEQSLVTITPAESIAGERFASAMAIDGVANLAAFALPTRGQIAIRYPGAGSWLSEERIDLELSPSRDVANTQLTVTASREGNTLAALAWDQSPDTLPELRLIERLGEGWLVLPLDLTEFNWSPGAHDNDWRITLDDDGERLLLQTRTTSGNWHALILERVGIRWHSLWASTTDTLLGLTTNEALDTLVMAHRSGDGIRLERLTLAHSDEPEVLGHQLMLDTQQPLELVINAAATDVLIYGWEVTGQTQALPGGGAADSSQATPVLWHHHLDSLLSVVESRRAQAHPSSGTELRLVADNDLSVVAYGWQNAEQSWLQVARQDNRGVWNNTVSLPFSSTSFSTFGQDTRFLNSLAIAADGSTLMLSVPADVDPGHAIVLQ